MWSDWRKTSKGAAGRGAETLDLAMGEDINSISGYSIDTTGTTLSLEAETSAGRKWGWGPFGDHSAGYGLSSSPLTSSGLRLHHLSGDQSGGDRILR